MARRGSWRRSHEQHHHEYLRRHGGSSAETSDPIYYISATNFNLQGMDEWVANFRSICHVDCFDGRHPNVFVPRERPHDPFTSIEDVNNYLLRHPDVVDFVKVRGDKCGKPVAVFLMFDQRTEELCDDLGLDIWFPPAKLRQTCDNKIETVRIGEKAGVASVPNALAEVKSYQKLRAVAKKAGLGKRLVVQTAYGDSGHTTFFISSKADWDRHEAEIAAEPEVKVMKRIEPRQATLEACVTRCGTVVGPLLTEIVGAPELTPYSGGWAGNELFPGAFTESVRAKARSYAEKFGDQLLKEGYRGYFDIDILVDQDDEVYLGELNPRICGASPITNHAAFAHADVPLFLFHLLEFSDADFDLDVGALNDRWSDPRYIDSWSAMVLKSTSPAVERVGVAPQSGIYRLDEHGEVGYRFFDYRRAAVETERDGFFLRITGPGDWRYEGADLGILITRGRLMSDDGELNERARQWLAGLTARYVVPALDIVPAQSPAEGVVAPELWSPPAPQPGAFKIL